MIDLIFVDRIRGETKESLKSCDRVDTMSVFVNGHAWRSWQRAYGLNLVQWSGKKVAGFDVLRKITFSYESEVATVAQKIAWS